jgi:hypothetical protein
MCWFGGVVCFAAALVAAVGTGLGGSFNTDAGPRRVIAV